jgi:hypothetical protein
MTTRKELTGSRSKGFASETLRNGGEGGKQGPDLGSQRCYSIVRPTKSIIEKMLMKKIEPSD